MRDKTEAVLRKMRVVIIVIGLLAVFPTISTAQDVNIKTNALYWATTTPNLGMELPLGRKHSAQLFFGFNPWKQGGGDHSSLRHWLLMPEWRYWFCQRYNGWFLGAHALGGQYNVAAVDLPFGLFPSLEDHRYKGWYIGGGITAGYQWPLSRHWSLEAALGLGYIYSPNDKYCPNCNNKLRHKDYNYVGPTKAALSVVYFIGGKRLKGNGAATYNGQPILTSTDAVVAPNALSGKSAVPVAKLAGNKIHVLQAEAKPQGDRMLVTMQMSLDSLHLRKSNQLVYTPILFANGDSVRLPEIVLNGKRENVLYRRGDFNGKYSDGAIAVARKNGKPQTVSYVVSVPVAKTPKDYSLGIQEDLCGCGDIENDTIYTLFNYKHKEPATLAFVEPKVEPEKIRHLDKRAYIDFPVDRTELHPDYRRNPEQLDSIINTINTIKNNSNFEVDTIIIHGYASPESPYSHNAMLAEGRAKTLTDYVRRQVNLPASVFQVASTPEDWDGLREYLKNGAALAHGNEILAIANDERLDPDSREAKIKKLYPTEYRYMLHNWYPALRHSDYHITFKVRPFNVDESRQIIKTQPQLLSLDEMFRLAQTYKAGSQEFNDVMETAVRMFPNDETANLNAAVLRLNARQPDAAKPFLDKAGNSREAQAARQLYNELKAAENE